MRIERKRSRGRWAGRSALMVLTLLVAFQTAGCGLGSDPTDAPPRPAIEELDEPAPLLPETTEYTEGKPTRLLARLALQGGRGLAGYTARQSQVADRTRSTDDG